MSKRKFQQTELTFAKQSCSSSPKMRLSPNSRIIHSKKSLLQPITQHNNLQLCPICEMKVHKNIMNEHLDLCLQKRETAEIQLKNDDEDTDAGFVLEATHVVEVEEVPGLYKIYDFINDEEERELMEYLEQTGPDWHRRY